LAGKIKSPLPPSVKGARGIFFSTTFYGLTSTLYSPDLCKHYYGLTYMSLIDKNNLSYLTTVEQYFLSLKDSGLALSASDYHIINQWEERQVPLPVVCRAIERGVVGARRQTRGANQRLSLSYLKDFIEQEIEQAGR
jgi:hypothetical protein